MNWDPYQVSEVQCSNHLDVSNIFAINSCRHYTYTINDVSFKHVSHRHRPSQAAPHQYDWPPAAASELQNTFKVLPVAARDPRGLPRRLEHLECVESALRLIPSARVHFSRTRPSRDEVRKGTNGQDGQDDKRGGWKIHALGISPIVRWDDEFPRDGEYEKGFHGVIGHQTGHLSLHEPLRVMIGRVTLQRMIADRQPE